MKKTQKGGGIKIGTRKRRKIRRSTRRRPKKRSHIGFGRKRISRKSKVVKKRRRRRTKSRRVLKREDFLGRF